VDEKKFLKTGYNIFKLKKDSAHKLRSIIISSIKEKIKTKEIDLDNFHKIFPKNKLNELRMHIYNSINKNNNFRKILYNGSKEAIEETVGSETVQSYISFSIQCPNDRSSLLTMHTDFYNCDSLFQINIWVPFVDVYKTKSMFIIDPKNSLNILSEMKNKKNITYQMIKNKYKSKIKWLNLKFGEGIVFSANTLHGNVTNLEKTTRWSINVRYKNLYSPYIRDVGNEKTIGGFYPIINAKLVTKFNLKYNFNDFLSWKD
jgi:sporadic carbohydrate cluster 2OG-Fe(II) oxygenase